MAKPNHEKARMLIDSMRLEEAEKLLKDNLKIDITSSATYDLLIETYKKKGDYHSLIKVLNNGIKHSDKKKKYRELKKKLILDKIIQDIDNL